MAIGLGVLRLTPDAFWRLTPAELTAAVAGLTGAGHAPPPPERAAFEALMRQHPDSPEMP